MHNKTTYTLVYTVFMNTFVHLLIFFLVLFLYVQIAHQQKRSEDLEVYEMDYVDNTNLQEVCDIQQPVLFEYRSHHPDFFQALTIDRVLNSGSYDVHVKDREDYEKKPDSVDSIVLPLQSSHTLMITDTHAKYFIENNGDFIDEAGLRSLFQENDSFLQPHFAILSNYDIGVGSSGASTPLRYHKDYRRYICVMSGKIRVKMTPWKSRKYLDVIDDYENYEFFSPVNVWKPQRNYFHEMDKLKFLEFDVTPGYVLVIPSYWWYSIQYSEHTLVSQFSYTTAMRLVVNIPSWVRYYIQQTNIQSKPVKKVDVVVDSGIEAEPDAPTLPESSS